VKRIFAALLTLFSTAVLIAASAAGPAGQWRVEFPTPLGQRGVNMTITNSGAVLHGHVVDEYGEYDLKGRFERNRVMVAWSVPESGRMLEITLKGTLDGNVIRGTATLGTVGDGPFSARRTGDVGEP
jgi:hypothetical protein